MKTIAQENEFLHGQGFGAPYWIDAGLFQGCDDGCGIHLQFAGRQSVFQVFASLPESGLDHLEKKGFVGCGEGDFCFKFDFNYFRVDLGFGG